MTLLLLAGTGDARRLASDLAHLPEVNVVASLAGATRDPLPLAVPTISGGFGGREQFKKWLQGNDIKWIIDATHPFAARISMRTADVARELNVNYLQLLRTPWEAQSGDDWTAITAEADAAELIHTGAKVFLATGRQTLNGFANLQGCTIYCRQIDPPDGPFPFPGGEFVIGRPPFSVDDEVRLFRQLGIDWLIVKNAGGVPSRTKLDAARVLGIPVLMISRPNQPDAERVTSPKEALEWLKTRL
jgi:precorrin-6A/cobalt-precorrin-6A reductase